MPRHSRIQHAVSGAQVVLALPFLVKHPVNYISRAFDFGRVFTHEWSINLQFLSADVFASRALAVGLLGAQVVVLVLFAAFRWRRLVPPAQPSQQQQLQRGGDGGVRADMMTGGDIAAVLLSANFIGVVFTRSMHYQFLCWYFHSLPILLWRTRLPVALRCGPACVRACLRACLRTTRGCDSAPPCGGGVRACADATSTPASQSCAGGCGRNGVERAPPDRMELRVAPGGARRDPRGVVDGQLGEGCSETR